MQQFSPCAAIGDKVSVPMPKNPGWEEMMSSCHGGSDMLGVRLAVLVSVGRSGLRLCKT